MPTIRLTDHDTAKARELWAEYQRQHDLSARKGDTAGIDVFTNTNIVVEVLPCAT